MHARAMVNCNESVSMTLEELDSQFNICCMISVLVIMALSSCYQDINKALSAYFDQSFIFRLFLGDWRCLIIPPIKTSNKNLPPTPSEEFYAVQILVKGGCSSYSRICSSVLRVNPELLGCFNDAFSSFSNEVFPRLEGEAPIMYLQYTTALEDRQYTLLLKALDSKPEMEEPLTFCYAFRGQLLTALQKLERFMQIIDSSPSIRRILSRVAQTGQTLTKADKARIDRIVDSIFLESSGFEEGDFRKSP